MRNGRKMDSQGIMSIFTQIYCYLVKLDSVLSLCCSQELKLIDSHFRNIIYIYYIYFYGQWHDSDILWVTCCLKTSYSHFNM